MDIDIIEMPDNYVDYMHEFFVAVAVMDDGREGVISSLVPLSHNGVLAQRVYIGATKADRDSIIKECRKDAKKLGKKIRVLRFTQREVIEQIEP